MATSGRGCRVRRAPRGRGHQGPPNAVAGAMRTERRTPIRPASTPTPTASTGSSHHRSGRDGDVHGEGGSEQHRQRDAQHRGEHGDDDGLQADAGADGRAAHAGGLEHGDVARAFEHREVHHRRHDQAGHDPQQHLHEVDRPHRVLQRSHQVVARVRLVVGAVSVGQRGRTVGQHHRRERLPTQHQRCASARCSVTVGVPAMSEALSTMPPTTKSVPASRRCRRRRHRGCAGTITEPCTISVEPDTTSVGAPERPGEHTEHGDVHDVVTRLDRSIRRRIRIDRRGAVQHLGGIGQPARRCGDGRDVGGREEAAGAERPRDVGVRDPPLCALTLERAVDLDDERMTQPAHQQAQCEDQRRPDDRDRRTACGAIADRAARPTASIVPPRPSGGRA